jgi:ribosomal protein S18 acetylase RimI-like enzyme
MIKKPGFCISKAAKPGFWGELMQTRQLTDKNEILRFLETDRLYAAYAIGDLEAALFEQSEWMGAEEGGRLRAVALLFKGLATPALFLMGQPDSLAAILRLQLTPEWVYVTCRKRHLRVLQTFYHTETPVPMWRMVLERQDFYPAAPSPLLEPLSVEDYDELQELYDQEGAAGAFGPAQLRDGIFYGVREQGKLVATAGTHLVSPTYRLGAVGNVYTDPAHRGQGYGSAATSAVTAELFRRGVRLVFLNVAQANVRAIHIYQRQGFSTYCPFLEMAAAKRLETIKSRNKEKK